MHSLGPSLGPRRGRLGAARGARPAAARSARSARGGAGAALGRGGAADGGPSTLPQTTTMGRCCRWNDHDGPSVL